MKIKTSKLTKGFTIIEMIVVVAVFLFIVGVAISIFISIVQNQKKVLSEQQLLNQISYTGEYMSKALRMARTARTNLDYDCLGINNMGYVYLLTRYDQSLGLFRGIKFVNQSDVDSLGNPACQEFFLDNTTDPSRPVLKELKNSNYDGDAVALNSSDLQINSVRFSVNGSDGSGLGCSELDRCGASELDSVQPRVTILLDVKISADNQEPDRIIQTTVSQRNLNAR